MAARDPSRPRKPRARKAAADAPPPPAPPRPLRWLLRWTARALLGLAAAALALILLYSVVNPPTNLYQVSESARLGGIEQEWVPFDQIAPVMARSAVAAEDANFCLHWGFDMAAIRAAMDDGAGRGASTITQQVVKNVFLWQGRSWLRKAIEAGLTPGVELVWSKRRILEIYLNVAEFGEGIFGVQAAARHYFDTDAANLTAAQSALLAAVLPDPKGRNPAKPGPFTRKRARQIADGAETILQDGRAACFEG
ncbi:monofunctional biosynthetic peptidoglycan transglycosylase [Neotabrizicola shimadae]|uniref:Biosynthetic peptidoglycan transglycosylase n=1 Tax=Neotabrizicola shimadae TaxID=2807096 RepID=A0A8G0ZT15_9RHOB|nr:monofunctional biosynthetic peptidoglycan transglycosylase [Neotabrizicola shimadae]QYZ68915.1 monofunctional biosynthetic peptidoglycan transglycosylase [Neotabrizicola shimadae]